jgi:carbon storage regulator
VLVLSRKVGEAIIVDHDVRVVVLSVDRRGVRLGIEAPAERPVLREELVIEVATQNLRAAATPLPDLLSGHLAPAPRATDPTDLTDP